MDSGMNSSAVGSDFIKHYGIPGMKWGVRRSRAALRKASNKKAEARVATIKSQGRTGYKAKGNKLTEAQLNQRIKRMEMEKKYNQLNSRTVGEGEAMARRIVSSVGEKTVKTVGIGVAYYAVTKAIEKKYGKEVASAIPKPKNK